MKLCKLCLKEKELSEFYTHKKMPDGHLSFCKECKKQYAKLNRSAEKDRIRWRSSPKKRLNMVYHNMMNRCYDINNNEFHRYGGRGIKVLWKNYREFYNDMVEGYIKHREYNGKLNNRQTQLDRINNNDNYCKDNCKRSTAKENKNNK